MGDTIAAIMNLAEQAGTALKPGDLAPDFELQSGEAEGTVSLAEYRRRGAVLLLMLRGLYCPFCRRGIGLLRPTCEALRKAGVPLLGVVIASPERARQYFRHFPACFPPRRPHRTAPCIAPTGCPR